jgi:hypothetical protein
MTYGQDMMRVSNAHGLPSFSLTIHVH